MGATMDAAGARGNKVFPNKSRKAVRSSYGSGGQGSMILITWDLLKGVLHDGGQSKVRQVIVPDRYDTLICHHPPDGHVELYCRHC